MRVTRIVSNLTVADTAVANRFYADALGLSIEMDQGWVASLGVPGHPAIHIQTLVGDATAPVDPVVSIGVDDLDAAYRRVRDAGAEIVYEIHDEEWGVRRFFFRDPDGNVINVVAHR